MGLSKDVIMQKVQRFGGAMFTPVILFGVFGILVGLAILCKNPMILGSIAEEGTLWWKFWYIVEQGSWTVFNQMPILFAIALPIGLAKKENARAAMESFVIFMVFNYFIQGILTLAGSDFGVDFTKNAGAGTGLAMIANIKTLDTGIVGAIIVAIILVQLNIDKQKNLCKNVADSKNTTKLQVFLHCRFYITCALLSMKGADICKSTILQACRRETVMASFTVSKIVITTKFMWDRRFKRFAGACTITKSLKLASAMQFASTG